MDHRRWVGGELGMKGVDVVGSCGQGEQIEFHGRRGTVRGLARQSGRGGSSYDSTGLELLGKSVTRMRCRAWMAVDVCETQ